MSFFPVGEFFAQFFSVLPALAPRLLLAWAATFAGLVPLIWALKRTIRPNVARLDARVRAWAQTVRYADVTATGAGAAERHARTWFFRFWTNFASAPALIFLSLALAIWATGRFDYGRGGARWFYLPGLCYAGSMLLSFVIKRVFKRARPVRIEGTFGHKLKDASFPSGHSLTSFCFWMALAAAATLAGMAGAGVALLIAAAFFVVAMTGLSRVYLGVHFPSDVLGGFSMGAIWCAACYFALRGAL